MRAVPSQACSQDKGSYCVNLSPIRKLRGGLTHFSVQHSGNSWVGCFPPLIPVRYKGSENRLNCQGFQREGRIEDIIFLYSEGVYG